MTDKRKDDVAEAHRIASLRGEDVKDLDFGNVFWAVGILSKSLRAASTPSVDTINIKREVLQGVRENLELIANVYTNDRHIPADTEAANALHGSLSHCDDLARQALASLDAVLSEGE